MGTTVYTNDGRFEAIHPNRTTGPTDRAKFGETSPDWRLNVHDAKVQDSGIYECQINTEPKRSKRYHLLVVGELQKKKTNYTTRIYKKGPIRTNFQFKGTFFLVLPVWTYNK